MVENVQFEDESSQGQVLYSRFKRSNKPPAIVMWFIKIGLAKTPQQANYILLAIALVAFGLSIYIFTDGFASFTPAQEYPPLELGDEA
jgi:hypothetical protein